MLLAVRLWIFALLRCGVDPQDMLAIHLWIFALLRCGVDPQDMRGGEDMMSGEEPSQICGRDRAVLRAVAAGRCELRAGCEPELVVDGVRCADSGVAQRLIAAGLVVKPVGSAVARLTPAGRVAAGLISA